MNTRNLDMALQAFRDMGGTLRTRDLIAQPVRTTQAEDAIVLSRKPSP